MSGTGEACYVDADLRQDDLGGEVTDPRHGDQRAGTLTDRRQGFRVTGEGPQARCLLSIYVTRKAL